MFVCIRLDEKDGVGMLALSGVEWTEGSRDVATVLTWFLTGMTIAGIVLVWQCEHFNPAVPALPFCAGICALSSWYWVWKIDFSKHMARRRFTFFSDGQMQGPAWVRRNGRYERAMAGRHEQIVSIESRMSPLMGVGKNEAAPRPTYEIVVYMRNGDVWIVGVNLEQDEAHKVAVELTHALARIRGSQATATKVLAQRMGAARLVN